MTLAQLFNPIVNQDFPPSIVFVYVDDQVKSIAVNRIAEYETQYEFLGVKKVLSEISKYSVKDYSLPVLTKKSVV
jgi:hypothetical protein